MDIALNNGGLGYDIQLTPDLDLQFTRGAAAIAQHVQMRLRTWLGETPYATNVGVPYLQVVFRKETPPAAVRYILIEQIRQVPGVDDVTLTQFDFDASTRALQVGGTILAQDEEVDFTFLLNTDAEVT